MAGICEAGHRSETDDYCDVCGLPVHAEAAPAAAAPQPAKAPAVAKCPNCGSTNPADALFCETCGYDFTTGELPRGDVASLLGIVRSAPPAAETPVAETPVAENPAAGTPVADIQEAPMTSTPEPADSLSIDTPAPLEPPQPLQAGDARTDLAGLGQAPGDQPDVEQPAEADPSVAAAAVPAEGTPVPPPAESTPAATESSPADDDAPTRGRPSPPKPQAYVAEVWIDPDWYNVQSSPDPMPSVGLPTVFALGTENLIGRVSRSRGIFPQVDCALDTGCSRQQASLTTDGTRWYVEDLNSSNGTYVAPASGPLPTDAITQRTELGPDDRIYVGAWTRIVVRKAGPGEIEGL